MASSVDTQAVKSYLLGLQDRITSATAALDGKSFVTDSWEKPRTANYRDQAVLVFLKMAIFWRKVALGSPM